MVEVEDSESEVSDFPIPQFHQNVEKARELLKQFKTRCRNSQSKENQERIRPMSPPSDKIFYMLHTYAQISAEEMLLDLVEKEVREEICRIERKEYE